MKSRTFPREEMHQIRPMLMAQALQVSIVLDQTHQAPTWHKQVPSSPIQNSRRLRDVHDVRLDRDVVVPKHHLQVVASVADGRQSAAAVGPVLRRRGRVRHQDVQPVVVLRIAHALGRIHCEDPCPNMSMGIVGALSADLHRAKVRLPARLRADDRHHAAAAVPLRENLVHAATRRPEPANQTAALHRQHHRVVPGVGLAAGPHQVAPAPVLKHALFRPQDAPVGRRHFQPQRRAAQQGQVHLHGGRHRTDRRTLAAHGCRFSDTRHQCEKPLRLRR